jgi:hypothetical protein
MPSDEIGATDGLTRADLASWHFLGGTIDSRFGHHPLSLVFAARERLFDSRASDFHQTTASLTMTFQIERRRVSTTSALWIALSLVVLSLPNVCWAISQACYNETAALVANEKIQIAYENYTGDGGCDFNRTTSIEVCSFDYYNSDSSVYEKVCFDAGGVYYTYDYTAECPADSTDENSTALYVHNWYEPDCLGKSCTTDEALVIFRSANINCTFNASFIETTPYEVSGSWSRYSSWWAMTTLSALVAVASVAL